MEMEQDPRVKDPVQAGEPDDVGPAGQAESVAAGAQGRDAAPAPDAGEDWEWAPETAEAADVAAGDADSFSS